MTYKGTLDHKKAKEILSWNIFEIQLMQKELLAQPAYFKYRSNSAM